VLLSGLKNKSETNHRLALSNKKGIKEEKIDSYEKRND
jgi:hypothetical protein